MLWTKLYTTYVVLRNDGHGEHNVAQYRNALTRFRAAHRQLGLTHILKNLHDNYTAEMAMWKGLRP